VNQARLQDTRERPTELTKEILSLLEQHPEGLTSWEIQEVLPGRRIRFSLHFLRRRGVVKVKREQRASIHWERFELAADDAGRREQR
jgi:hypothetical protein